MCVSAGLLPRVWARRCLRCAFTWPSPPPCVQQAFSPLCFDPAFSPCVFSRRSFLRSFPPPSLYCALSTDVPPSVCLYLAFSFLCAFTGPFPRCASTGVLPSPPPVHSPGGLPPVRSRGFLAAVCVHPAFSRCVFTRLSPPFAFTRSSPLCVFTRCSQPCVIALRSPLCAFTRRSPFCVFPRRSPLSVHVAFFPLCAFTRRFPFFERSHGVLPSVRYFGFFPLCGHPTFSFLWAVTRRSPLRSFAWRSPS